MSDRYLEFTQSPFGKSLSSLLGLPQPPRLRRASEPWTARPLDGKFALLGAASRGELAPAAMTALTATGAGLRIVPEHPGLPQLKESAAKLGLNLAGNPAREAGAGPNHALVFDASGIASPAQLRELYDFFAPVVRELPGNGRVLILSRSPEAIDDIGERTAAASLSGFMRSLGKEIGKNGSTANLVEVAKGGEAALEPVLRFLLTEHAAFVSGQVVRVGAPVGALAALPGSLAGKVALVTGAARGIGASISQVLAREGAQVVGMDHPSSEGALGETMAKVNGMGLALDVTAPEAGARIAEEVGRKFGGLDIVVHNAGVTRDKMLRNMPPQLWDMVLGINLGAILRINEGLLRQGLNDGARMVCISSIGGISGNPGQTNYGATKAGLIGYADALAPVMARRGGAINAVAPGFIETHMTAEMPIGPREVGRRLNSLSQGGLPQDIAEAVAFLASQVAAGINGRTLRVCGQNFVGA
ncbi:MAG TPA: 3-oxoacyl-ACP reductase [Solimonas sp.]|nr:3-oxoacyl-ACP reductase [Solimonas sp.]